MDFYSHTSIGWKGLPEVILSNIPIEAGSSQAVPSYGQISNIKVYVIFLSNLLQHLQQEHFPNSKRECSLWLLPLAVRPATTVKHCISVIFVTGPEVVLGTTSLAWTGEEQLSSAEWPYSL